MTQETENSEKMGRCGRGWRGWWLLAPVFAAAAVFIFGTVVMYLWNAIMPAVFGLHEIMFWQAIGLLVLSKILFGGFRGGWRRGGCGCGGYGWRGRRSHWQWKEKWMNMSEEEKAKMKEEWKKRCSEGNW